MQRFVDVLDATTGAMAAQVGGRVGEWVEGLCWRLSKPACWPCRQAHCCLGMHMGASRTCIFPTTSTQPLPPPASPPLGLRLSCLRLYCLQLSSEHMTAIASRNAAHPALPVLACATNSGRIHIYRS